MEMRGKVALVTGGGSGIGRATSERLAELGATVVVADLDLAAAESVGAGIGGRAVAMDVADPEAWAALVADVRSTEGGLDLVHLNAGVTTGQPDITALTDEQYRRVTGANVDGVVFGVRAVVPELERRGGGAIVVTASIAGLAAFPVDPVYTLTKHAVVGLVRALAPALEPKGITISAVCPGIVDTPLVGAEAKAVLAEVGYPLLAPDDIATAVLDAVGSGAAGECYVCQPGRAAEPFTFGVLPGTDDSPTAEPAERLRARAAALGDGDR